MGEKRSSVTERHAAAGIALFSDPLGEVTRSNQWRLLVASTVSVLLVSGAVRLEKLTIAGAELVPKPVYVLMVAGIFCVYFLVIYSLSVIQDLRVGRFRRLPALAEIRLAVEETTLKHRLELEAHDRKVQQLLDHRSARLRAVRELDLPPMEKLRRLNEETEAFKNDGLEEAQRTMWLRLHAHTQEVLQIMSIAELPGSANRLDLFRHAVDVVFPLAFGLVAVSWTAWRLLR